ncbi:MAG: cysteine desulfurase [Phycisphaerae bacterium]|nr:cysteine desulfurase [Phycisphaerae bacterium]
MQMHEYVYLDNAATTKVDPEVVSAMMEHMLVYYANPSSSHFLGRSERQILENARQKLANYINCHSNELVFTSGGTEADNIAILGVAKMQSEKKNHIISSEIEHKAVLSSLGELERQGYSVTYVKANRDGIVDPEEIERLVRPETFLVSIMYTNNELGTIQPIGQIAHRVRKYGILMHSDAVQALGKIQFNVKDLGVDMLTVSSHKIHGPKGAGALYIREGTAISSMSFGGNQERGLRSGTENIPAIIGFVKAVEMLQADFWAQNEKIKNLREYLEQSILSQIKGTAVNGCKKNRISSISNVNFNNIDSDYLLKRLSSEHICISSGSACQSSSMEPSHVLTSMGYSNDSANNSVRFSLSRDNTKREIDYVLDVLVRIDRDVNGEM